MDWEFEKPNLTTEIPTPPRENRAWWWPRTRRHAENQEISNCDFNFRFDIFQQPFVFVGVFYG